MPSSPTADMLIELESYPTAPALDPWGVKLVWELPLKNPEGVSNRNTITGVGLVRASSFGTSAPDEGRN